MEVVSQEIEESGLTSKELAEKSGLDEETILMLKEGKMNPTIETLEKLATGLGATLKISFNFKGKKKRKNKKEYLLNPALAKFKLPSL